MNYTIYCDGAATMKKINGSYVRCAGGHAFIVYQNGINVFEFSDGVRETTNNEQELLAIRDSLKWLKENSNFDSFSEATIFSDSAYCVNIFNRWIEAWKENEWTRGRKHEPIENLEIIKEIYFMLKELKNVKIEKVKGHSTCVGNNLADKLAVEAKKKFQNLES